jgi:competence protein ComEC
MDLRIGRPPISKTLIFDIPSILSRFGSDASRIFSAFDEAVAAERDRWFPWSVAAFAAGSIIYFSLKSEPLIAFACLSACLGIGFAIVSRRSSKPVIIFLCLLLAASCFGFADAKWRTERVDAPVIVREIGRLRIEGRIESVLLEDERNARIRIAPTRVGRDLENLPRRLRLSLRGERTVSAVAPGTRVSLVAIVRPPPEPAMPGGYDFARWASFSGIGGVGFVLGTPESLDPVTPPNFVQRCGASIELLRRAMSARIQDVVPGSNGAISAALITGERAAISEDDNNAYRDSGLFHVLSISGVHMALAGLGIFWIVRAILALSPTLALHYPIKKWAAVAAVLAATFYVFISGASAPAVRSYIMLLVMLLGVLADRPVLSMRSVAISALLLLTFEPEGVVEPSFQMSLSTIIGLIALAEWQRKLAGAAAISGVMPGGVVRWLSRYFVVLILASVVAGLATAPFAIYHFDRAPGYSLLANLLASPVVGMIIMPSACLSVALMPLGLDEWPLHAMGWGVSIMTDIAHWVADLPGAVNLVAAKSETVLALIVAGGLWIGLWRRRWRCYVCVGIMLGIILALGERSPDILIARDARSAAIRDASGHYVIIGDPDDYAAAQWLLRDGDARPVEEARNEKRCDEFGCVAETRDETVVALALRPGALADDCARADIIISAVPIRRDCANPIHSVDRFDVYWGGAIALYLSEGGHCGGLCRQPPWKAALDGDREPHNQLIIKNICN